jgi:hypothetical protein
VEAAQRVSPLSTSDTRVFVVVHTNRPHTLRHFSAQERRTVAGGKNRVSGESGKGMKP